MATTAKKRGKCCCGPKCSLAGCALPGTDLRLSWVLPGIATYTPTLAYDSASLSWDTGWFLTGAGFGLTGACHYARFLITCSGGVGVLTVQTSLSAGGANCCTVSFPCSVTSGNTGTTCSPLSVRFTVFMGGGGATRGSGTVTA